MIITYDEFCDYIDKKVNGEHGFNRMLLDKIIDEPTRFCGLFRLSNPKAKIIQNISQSREVKFGDIVEYFVTVYIENLGYINLEKDLGKNNNGDDLKVDQIFYKENSNDIYIVEMKIRDDHDSTKKRGQYSNFQKKMSLVKQKYPGKHQIAIMWFVDDSLQKNRSDYEKYMEKDRNGSYSDIDIKLLYGKSFFDLLDGGPEAWDEFISLMEKFRDENPLVEIDVPPLGSDEDILKELVNLPESKWNKLISDDPEYILLRKDLFSEGDNIEKAKEIREGLCLNI